MKAMRYANEVPEGDLYIPHGSDERNPRPRHFHLILNSLYPTWFRWKREREFILRAFESTFISHMVQMKDVKDQ